MTALKRHADTRDKNKERCIVGKSSSFRGTFFSQRAHPSKTITMRQYFRRMATYFGNYERMYDEESQERELTSHRRHSRKCPRIRRQSWNAVCLLLVDLVLVGLLIHLLWPLISLLRHNKDLFPAHVVVTSHDPPEAFQPPKQPQVPRIFHQTCKNGTIPSIWAESQKSCLKTYSNFEYKVRSF